MVGWIVGADSATAPGWRSVERYACLSSCLSHHQTLRAHVSMCCTRRYHLCTLDNLHMVRALCALYDTTAKGRLSKVSASWAFLRFAKTASLRTVRSPERFCLMHGSAMHPLSLLLSFRVKSCPFSA